MDGKELNGVQVSPPGKSVPELKMGEALWKRGKNLNDLKRLRKKGLQNKKEEKNFTLAAVLCFLVQYQILF